jgi:hypothetical protein
MSYCRNDGRCETCDPPEHRDPDSENELAQERATDLDRQRMDYGHQFGAFDTPEETARKLNVWADRYGRITR